MKLFQLKKTLLPIIGFGLLAPVVYAAPSPNVYATSSDEFSAFPLIPRLSVTGLAGTDFTGSGDGIVPLVGDANQIFYTDVQGRYGEEGTWMGSIGAGYRRVVNNARILGGYVFVDHDESQRGNQYWLVSPGIESMGNVWDFRANGYIPVSDSNKAAGTAFACDAGDCQFVTFKMHQQFDHVFDLTEEAGTGFDGEVGRVIPFLGQTRAYLGGYYFQFKDSKSMNGISGRLEYPALPHVAIIASDNYDNIQHNTALIGLRLSVGGFSNERTPSDIEERILDPITRGLGAQNNGTGVPIVLATHDEGSSVLSRDNIYFFTANGGTAFNAANGSGNCTFEHPCTGGSWTQTNVNSINGFTPNTNFYFNGGTYTNIDSNLPLPPPNSNIALNNGQSMYGRTANYSCPAMGNDRPLFLGGFVLNGNDTLDSIQVMNSLTHSGNAGNITAITVNSNSPNINFNNDAITAQAMAVGNLVSFSNFATGVSLSSNSQISISNSSINALASISGTSTGGVNLAAGIGRVDGASTVISGNTLTINNSTVNGTASVGGNNMGGLNLAVGIGADVVTNSTNFSGNIFRINNSSINGTASIGGNNTSDNAASGIGGNASNTGSSASFSGDTYTINNSSINGTASIGGINSASNNATGIGGNARAGTATFSNENFALNDSNVSGGASVGGNNTSVNFAEGIGGNTITGGNASFTTDNFNINGSTLNASASVGGNNTLQNFASGIGGNASGGTSLFTNDMFTINNDQINTTAKVTGTNNATAANQATGMKADTNSVFTVTGGTVTTDASVGTNLGTNSALPTVVTGTAPNTGKINTSGTVFNTHTSP